MQNKEKLRELVRIKFDITLRSPMHIGMHSAEEGSLYFPLKMARDIRGIPFIPGTTIRGAIRVALENFLRGINPSNEDGRPRSCDIFSANACGAENPCDICKLFGTRGITSRASVRDAFWKTRDYIPALTTLRTKVPIHRESATLQTADGVSFECVQEGAIFCGEIEIYNPLSWEIGLIFLSLDMLEKGWVKLGGMSATGGGRVGIFVKEIQRLALESLLETTKREGPGEEEEPSGKKETLRDEELPPPLADLIEIASRRLGDIPVRELQQLMTNEKGWSNVKYREAGFRDIGKVIAEGEKRGKLEFFAGRVKMKGLKAARSIEEGVQESVPLTREESKEVKAERQKARAALMLFLEGKKDARSTV